MNQDSRATILLLDDNPRVRSFVKPALEDAGFNTQRLDLMVRMDMTGQPLVMEPVNVPALLEDLIIDLGPAADAKDADTVRGQEVPVNGQEEGIGAGVSGLGPEWW